MDEIAALKIPTNLTTGGIPSQIGCTVWHHKTIAMSTAVRATLVITRVKMKVL